MKECAAAAPGSNGMAAARTRQRWNGFMRSAKGEKPQTARQPLEVGHRNKDLVQRTAPLALSLHAFALSFENPSCLVV